MPYKCEWELEEMAGRLVEVLAEAGMAAAIQPGSFRDYLVKVSISRAGRSLGQVSLYYSPKKNRFSLKTGELSEPGVVREVEVCWQKLVRAEGNEPGTAPQGLQAYVDGSCLADSVGYGVVILRDGEPVAELSGLVEDETLLGMRQVGGELLALCRAIEWCHQNNVQEVAVFYDYAGIEKWATGEWKASNPATRAYAEFMRDCPISIRWQKVDSHSGDRWNDRADQLARAGAQQRRGEKEPAQDLLLDLEEKARTLVGLLEKNGIAARYQGIVNGQFARVVVAPQRGYVDLYNSRRRPISKPYLHGFSDTALLERVESLWRGYLAGEAVGRPATADPLSEATFYYEILKPYGDCAFDFVDLAAALDRAYRRAGRPGLDIESIRHDFRRLENAYLNLKGGDKA